MAKYKNLEDIKLSKEDIFTDDRDDSEEMTDEEYANQMWEDEDLDDFFSDILND